MNAIIASIGLTIITTIHTALNALTGQKKMSGVLYVTYEGRMPLLTLREKLPGTTLLSISGFEKSSLLRRKSMKDTIRFTTTITSPFIGLHFREKHLKKHLSRFMYTNQRRFLERNAFTKILMIDEFSIPQTALTAAAKDAGIVTIALQHGIIDDNHCFYDEYKRRGPRETVDYLLVYSGIEKRILLKDGSISEERIIITGCPRYDRLRTIAEQDNKPLRKKYGFEKTTVLWMTQSHDPEFGPARENEKNCSALFPFFARHKKQYQLAIKLHPNENQRAPLYRSYDRRHGTKAIIFDGDHDTEELIAAADIVLVKSSSTWMEAYLVGKPLVRLELCGNNQESMYVGSGLDIVIRRPADIAAALEKSTSQYADERFLKTRASLIRRRFPHFGNATEAAIRNIRKLELPDRKKSRNA